MQLRYLLISAAIIFGGTIAVAAWVNRDFVRIKIASVNVPMSPKPGRLESLAPASQRPLEMAAPWILSELPFCLEQESDTIGPPSYVEAQIPRGAQPISPKERLTYGNCTIVIGSDEGWVAREEDKFYIPPHVKFFRVPGEGLAVLRNDGKGMELRVYAPLPKS